MCISGSSAYCKYSVRSVTVSSGYSVISCTLGFHGRRVSQSSRAQMSHGWPTQNREELLLLSAVQILTRGIRPNLDEGSRIS